MSTVFRIVSGVQIPQVLRPQKFGEPKVNHWMAVVFLATGMVLSPRDASPTN